jgi:hypothetical protein
MSLDAFPFTHARKAAFEVESERRFVSASSPVSSAETPAARDCAVHFVAAFNCTCPAFCNSNGFPFTPTLLAAIHMNPQATPRAMMVTNKRPVYTFIDAVRRARPPGICIPNWLIARSFSIDSTILTDAQYST